MENNEKPIILVVVTFFLAMTLVYITFFRRHWFWQIAVDDIEPVLSDTGTAISDVTVPSTIESVVNTGVSSPLLDFDTSWYFDSSWLLVGAWLSDLLNKSSLSGGEEKDFFLGVDVDTWWWKKKIQSNAALSVWYGSIEMADSLWLPFTDAFTDTGNTYYAYLGTGTLDTLAPTVRRLWWNVLAIETKNDINKNLLRWDRILFVNIPEVTFVRKPTDQKLLVAMIVYVGEDKWLIVAKIDRYYASKLFMKTIFEQLYGKPL